VRGGWSMFRRKNSPREELLKRLSDNLNQLYSYLEYIQDRRNSKVLQNSSLMAKVLNESTRIEEILDLYGAKENSAWYPFRQANSAIKRFSNIMYIALHLYARCPYYRLKGDREAFVNDTWKILGDLGEILTACIEKWLDFGKSLRIPFQTLPLPDMSPERNEITKLPVSRKKTKINEPERFIVNMATSFLNLFTNTEILDLCPEGDCDFSNFIPEQINESQMRSLETEFHNLQSFYDTNIAFTNVEDYDPSLPLIRGHASLIFHLLEGATDLIHYYERHMINYSGQGKMRRFLSISQDKVLNILFQYCIRYSRLFLDHSISLCREVIQQYAEKGQVTVPVPQYRGFHVRPSTLVAKIVQHYGSEVSLFLDDFKCNAAVPLDLFRLNEKINAQKRKSISHTLKSLKSVKNPTGDDLAHKVNGVFQELIDRELITSYSLVPHIPDLKKLKEESFGEYINRLIAAMLAEGAIDIRTDTKVVFEGDKRVLDDLKILAENGYGEDPFGNNIMLPKELSYLHR